MADQGVNARLEVLVNRLQRSVLWLGAGAIVAIVALMPRYCVGRNGLLLVAEGSCGRYLSTPHWPSLLGYSAVILALTGLLFLVTTSSPRPKGTSGVNDSVPSEPANDAPRPSLPAPSEPPSPPRKQLTPEQREVVFREGRAWVEAGLLQPVNPPEESRPLAMDRKPPQEQKGT